MKIILALLYFNQTKQGPIISNILLLFAQVS